MAWSKNDSFEPINTVDVSGRNEVFTSISPIMLPELDTFRTSDWIKALRDIQYVPVLSRFIGGLTLV